MLDVPAIADIPLPEQPLSASMKHDGKHAGNAVVSRLYRHSCIKMQSILKLCTSETEIFVTDPLSYKNIVETLRGYISILDDSLEISEDAHIKAHEACAEFLQLYESQRASSAFRVAALIEHITQTQGAFAKRYSHAKEIYDQSELDNAHTSFISYTKKQINSSPVMDAIQVEADQTLDTLGGQLRQLQNQEVQSLRDLT